MSSSVGPAVNNFISIVTAAVPTVMPNEGDTQIVFGELSKYVAPVTLQIMEVTGNAQVAEIGRNFRREETYSIICEIVTWAGDQDYVTRFNDAVSVYNAVTVAVAKNPWLSTSGLNDSTAAVRFAEIGDFTMIPHADVHGQSRCALQFHVRCSARVDSLD